jgi:hypothetical protein
MSAKIDFRSTDTGTLITDGGKGSTAIGVAGKVGAGGLMVLQEVKAASAAKTKYLIFIYFLEDGVNFKARAKVGKILLLWMQ